MGTYKKREKKKFEYKDYLVRYEKNRDENILSEIQKRADELGISQTSYIKYAVLQSFDYDYFNKNHGETKKRYIDSVLNDIRNDKRSGQ